MIFNIIESGLIEYCSQMTSSIQMLKPNWHRFEKVSEDESAINLNFVWEAMVCGLTVATIVFGLELLVNAISAVQWHR